MEMHGKKITVVLDELDTLATKSITVEKEKSLKKLKKVTHTTLSEQEIMKSESVKIPTTKTSK